MNTWTTPVIDQYIIDQRGADVSYEKIAASLQKPFGISVTKNSIIRRARTLGVWVGKSVIAERVVLTDDQKALFISGMSNDRSIAEQALLHGISPKVVSRLRRELRPNLDPVKAARDEEFKAMFARGMSVLDIAKVLKIGHNTARKWRDRLQLERTRPEKVVVSKPKMVVVRPPRAMPLPKARSGPQPKPATHVSGTASVFRFRGLSLPKLPESVRKQGGTCFWPLSCTAPAEKNWCAYHAGLIGRVG